MDFRILGPVEVYDGDRRLVLAGPKPRTLLAALLLEPGQPVATSRLVDGVWGEQSPGTATALIQTYVSALRRALAGTGRELIVTRPPGYAIDVDPCEVDLTRFNTQAAKGRQAAAAGRHQEAAELFAAALALWRGPALGGLGESFMRAAGIRLDELRLAVTEERIAADLVTGRAPNLVAELSELVHAHPLRERLRGQLMLALYRTGRQADALTVYREGRTVLIDELGIEPGEELRELHEAVLRGSADLAQPATAEVQVAVPAQLPPATSDFVGRAKQVDHVVGVLGSDSPAMTVCAVSGAAGTGKTALAVHAARKATPSYPDGQLFATLRGAAAPVAPGEVLARFLRALGVSSVDLPESVEERAALYRSRLAGRRVLVVLDDALSEEQVRPLLPGDTGCAALVTSRVRLAGLAGAALLDLDVLPSDEAITLLSQVAGPDRVAAEPDAALEMVTLCGHLPLAVRTAGARLAAREHWPLSHFVRRLSDERRRLDELSAGDLAVRASLTLSYAGLGEVEQAAFRRLGLLGVPDFAPWIAGPLLDLPVPEAEQVVERLVDARLLDAAGLDATGQVRYRLHDLLGVYARECAEAEDPRHERDAAVTRVLGSWLWLVNKAALRAPSGVLRLARDTTAEVPVDPVVASELVAAAGAWFEAEQAGLVTAVERAAAMDLDGIACELAAALVASPVAVRNQFDEWWRTHDAGLAAARRAGNRRGEAMLLAGLGQLRYEQDRFSDAHRYLHDALAAFREVKDAHGEAAVLATLSTVSREQGHFAEAVRYLDQAREGFVVLSDAAGLAYATYGLGTIHREQGRFAEALAAFDEAVAAYRSTGSRRGEALTLRGIGLVHRAEGELSYAAELFEQAVTIFTEINDRLHKAYAMQSLAKVRIRQGRGAEALVPLEHCLSVCLELGDRYGEALMLRTIGELHLAAGRQDTGRQDAGRLDARRPDAGRLDARRQDARRLDVRRLDVAEEFLRRALALWRTLDVPLFAARTLRDLSTLHAERGEDEAAATALEEALEIFRTFDSREARELATA